jgi:hypothetical protein
MGWLPFLSWDGLWAGRLNLARSRIPHGPLARAGQRDGERRQAAIDGVKKKLSPCRTDTGGHPALAIVTAQRLSGATPLTALMYPREAADPAAQVG